MQRGRQRPALMDAGGARRREMQQRELAQRQTEELRAARERIAGAAGKIPVLKSLENITKYASYVEGGMWDQGRRWLSFPALQVSKKLQIADVFKALPQNFNGGPNVMAERHDQPNVGAHFDNYGLHGFMPWTMIENLKGKGAIRAAFLSTKAYEAYKTFAGSLPNTDGAQELLAQNRAFIGAEVLAHAGIVYEGPIEPQTRTLLWHGNRWQGPAVHEVIRDQPGSYRIYAQQNLSIGDLAEGFERL